MSRYEGEREGHYGDHDDDRYDDDRDGREHGSYDDGYGNSSAAGVTPSVAYHDEWDGDDGNEHHYGSDGNDIARGRGGDDIIEGGLGDDQLYGGLGNDRLLGGLGNDQLRGGKGDDELIGGGGLDEIWGGIGANVIRAGLNDGAVDTIIFGADSAKNPVGNPSGSMRDLLLELEATDVIRIVGVADSSLTYLGGVVDPNGSGLTGVGIYANGNLEALVVGSLSVDQVNSMTTGLI